MSGRCSEFALATLSTRAAVIGLFKSLAALPAHHCVQVAAEVVKDVVMGVTVVHPACITRGGLNE